MKPLREDRPITRATPLPPVAERRASRPWSPAKSRSSNEKLQVERKSVMMQRLCEGDGKGWRWGVGEEEEEARCAVRRHWRKRRGERARGAAGLLRREAARA